MCFCCCRKMADQTIRHCCRCRRPMYVEDNIFLTIEYRTVLLLCLGRPYDTKNSPCLIRVRLPSKLALKITSGDWRPTNHTEGEVATITDGIIHTHHAAARDNKTHTNAGQRSGENRGGRGCFCDCEKYQIVLLPPVQHTAQQYTE